MSEEEKETKETDVQKENLILRDQTQYKIINIDDYKRNIIFICLVLVSILSSCDGGIVPQQNSTIQKEFGGDGEKRVGLFGSIDYIGRVVGAIIFTIIMGRMNRKLMLVITLIFKSLTLFVPLITVNYYINTVARCLSGLSQVFYPTYLPVWCDQYAKKEKRTIWVTLVQIGNPIGIIFGYGLGMICDSIFPISGWRTAFAVEGVVLIICALIVFLFEDSFFSEKFILIEDSKGKLVELTEEQKKVELFSNIGKIICNKIFIFSSFCNSVAFFGIGVVQYFGDKYMKLVLKIGKTSRFFLFAFLCLFGPTTGMVCGGIICSKLGGYVKRRSMVFVILCMAIASTISMLISFHKIKIIFVITAWTYLFAIGGVIPPLSGIIISCLDNNLRGDGFSFCNFLNNLIGNFPSSYIYSLLVDAFAPEDDEHKEEEDQTTDKYRYAWMITMGYNFVGLLFVIIAGIFRFKIKGDLSEDKKEEEEGETQPNGNEFNSEQKDKITES